MGSWSQVLGTFVAHDKLNPKDSSVQGLHRLVMVNLRQLDSASFVPGKGSRDKKKTGMKPQVVFNMQSSLPIATVITERQGLTNHLS